MKGDSYGLYSEDKKSTLKLLKNEGFKKNEEIDFECLNNEHIEILKEIFGEISYLDDCNSYSLSVDQNLIEILKKEKEKLLQHEKLKDCYLSTLKFEESDLVNQHWIYSDYKEEDHIAKKIKFCENSCLRNKNGELMGWMLLQNANYFIFLFFLFYFNLLLIFF